MPLSFGMLRTAGTWWEPTHEVSMRSLTTLPSSSRADAETWTVVSPTTPTLALGVLPAGSLSWRREPLIRVRLRLEPVSTISRTGSALPPSSRVTRPSTTGRLFSTVRGSSTPPPGCAKASGSWSSTRRDAGSISTT